MTSYEFTALFIGGCQLLVGLLVWAGIDRKMLGNAVPEISPRNKLLGLLLVGGLGFSGVGFYRTVSKPTNPENVESRVRSWLDAFRFNVHDDPSDDAYFRLIVNMENGNKITIGRFKGYDQFILLRAALVPDAQASAVLTKLPYDQAQELAEDIVTEMARAKMAFTNTAPPFSHMLLERRIPISDALTENVLLNQIDAMDYAMVLVRNTITRWRRTSKMAR
jgi:hypothetical protein